MSVCNIKQNCVTIVAVSTNGSTSAAGADASNAGASVDATPSTIVGVGPV